MEMKIEHIPVDRLVPYARNARTHSDEQIAQIVPGKERGRMEDSEREPTEWRVVPGFSDYEVSSQGEVRRRTPGAGGTKVGRALRAHICRRTGYRRMGLRAPDGGKRMVSVHRLVAMAFLGPSPSTAATMGMLGSAPACWTPPSPSAACQVAHADGDRENNLIANLRWATPKENARDKRLHGTWPAGRSNGRAKLTLAQVREIRACGTDKYGSKAALAREYGVSDVLIGKIQRRELWPKV